MLIKTLFFLLGMPLALADTGPKPILKVILGGDSKPVKTLIEQFNATTELGFQLEAEESDTLGTDLENGTTEGDLVMLNGAGLAARVDSHFAQIDSPILKRNIPAHLRDHNDRWYGFAKRFRILYYNKNLVDPARDGLHSYEDLADAKWQGKLCLRHSDKEYNQTLVGFFLETLGLEKTRTLLQGWMNNHPWFTEADQGTNLTDPQESAKGVLTAIHSGKCAVGIANTYYVGYFMKGNHLSYEDTPVRPLLPNQREGEAGAHVNIQAFAIPATSQHRAEAQRFMEWLSQPIQQHFYSDMANFHPVSTAPSALPSWLEITFGSVRENTSFDLGHAVVLKNEATELMKSVGWKTLTEIKK